MSARLVVMESVVEAPTFCYRCDRERDRNTIEGLYEPWLKTGDGIVCPSCLLPRERAFIDAQLGKCGLQIISVKSGINVITLAAKAMQMVLKRDSLGLPLPHRGAANLPTFAN